MQCIRANEMFEVISDNVWNEIIARRLLNINVINIYRAINIIQYMLNEAAMISCYHLWENDRR